MYVRWLGAHAVQNETELLKIDKRNKNESVWQSSEVFKIKNFKYTTALGKGK